MRWYGRCWKSKRNPSTGTAPADEFLSLPTAYKII